MKSNGFILLVLMLFAILSGCKPASLEPGSSEGVTFTVAVDADMFSEEAIVRIAIWSADQLETMKRTADCAVSYDAETQAQEVHCPEGIEYEQPTPEEHSFPRGEIGEVIEVVSEGVRVGENYRLVVSGLSSDDCNMASASVEDVAQSAHITIDPLLWATTLMACP